MQDIGAGQTIVAIPSIISLNSSPKWSPDGQQILITGVTNFPLVFPNVNFEVFVVSRDGKVTQSTDFEAYNTGISLNSYSWSPNGRYVAFWLRTNRDPVERLAVLEVSTLEVVNYCVPGIKSLGAYPPIWSPDSQQLVVLNPKGKKPVIVVDNEQKKAAAIGKNLDPVLWLRFIPEVWIKNSKQGAFKTHRY